MAFNIVLCDDDEFSRELLHTNLTAVFPQANIYHAENLLDIWQVKNPDLVILDKLLDGENGSEYIGNLPCQYIVFSGVADTTKGEIRKPNIDELIKRIESIKNAG